LLDSRLVCRKPDLPNQQFLRFDLRLRSSLPNQAGVHLSTNNERRSRWCSYYGALL